MRRAASRMADPHRDPVPPEFLGEDFAELVARVGSRLVDVVPLTRLAFRLERRACFRLHFADGRAFKYRRMASAVQAAALERLISRIGSPRIPRVLDRHGAGLLIEFVEGRALRWKDQTPDLLAECAALHGRIHETPANDLLAEAPPFRITDEAADVGRRIDGLVAQKAITATEADGLVELAMNRLPRACEMGIIHRDFCAENLVISEAGDPFIVDNEAIRIGAFDFCLARTWYRWPMRPSEREAYWESYARHRDPRSLFSFFLFWSINAMVKSALVRLRGNAPEAAVPIRKLKILLRRADPGATTESYLRW